jgi:hypothetical protein
MDCSMTVFFRCSGRTLVNRHSDFAGCIVEFTVRLGSHRCRFRGQPTRHGGIRGAWICFADRAIDHLNHGSRVWLQARRRCNPQMAIYVFQACSVVVCCCILCVAEVERVSSTRLRQREGSIAICSKRFEFRCNAIPNNVASQFHKRRSAGVFVSVSRARTFQKHIHRSNTRRNSTGERRRRRRPTTSLVRGHNHSLSCFNNPTNVLSH